MERLEWCIPVRSPRYSPYSPLQQKYASVFIAGSKAKHCCPLRKAGSTFVRFLVWKLHPLLIKLHFLYFFFLFFWFLWGETCSSWFLVLSQLKWYWLVMESNALCWKCCVSELFSWNTPSTLVWKELRGDYLRLSEAANAFSEQHNGSVQ